MKERRFVFEVSFLVLAVACAMPLWTVDHPPIQDLPQHLAAIRVLTDFGDPALHFRDYFVIELGRTQYLGYYLLTALLTKLFGLMLANRLVVTAAIVGTPYALRFLLRALDRDERAAILAMPLTWNAHLILGFVNFIGAIPLMLVAIALAIRLRQSGGRRHAVALALVLVATFYTHVVPFGFAAAAVFFLLIGDGLRETTKRLLSLLPSAVAMLVWVARSPAGRATLTAARGSAEGGPAPLYASVSDSFTQIPMWLTDVLHGETDEQLLAAFGVTLLAAIVLPSVEAAGSPIVARARLVVAAMVPLAAIAYFVAPDSYDFIWPIHARFPLLALVFVLACVRFAPRVPDAGVVLVASALTILSVREVASAFESFERVEVGQLERAIATIPRGERVVGLMWNRSSQFVKFSPFIHSVAWYQAKRGGAVMFTFDDFPQSPIRFRDDNRPERVWPRWEWTPERVDVRRQLGWYRWALVRGGPGSIGDASDVFHLEGTFGEWRVYRRIAP